MLAIYWTMRKMMLATRWTMHKTSTAAVVITFGLLIALAAWWGIRVGGLRMADDGDGVVYSQGSAVVRLDRDGNPQVEGLLIRMGSRRLRDQASHLSWIDGGRSLLSLGRAFHVWDASTGNESSYWDEPALGLVITSSPDGGLVASNLTSYAVPSQRPDLDENVIVIWDVAARRRLKILRGHSFPVTALAFSIDGLKLASGSADGSVRVWDVESGRQLAEFTWRGGVTLGTRTDACVFVAFSPDGLTLASMGIDPAPTQGRPADIAFSVKLWELSSSKAGRVLEGRHVAFSRAAFSGDGSEIFACGSDGRLWAWRTTTGEPASPLPLTTRDLMKAIATSRDGKWVATGDTEGKVRLWDVREHRQARVIDTNRQNLMTLAFDPDGGRLASGGGGTSIKLWDVATGSRLLADDEGHDDAILCLAYAPGGDLLATGGVDGSIRLWDATSGRTLGKLRGHDGFVDCLAFSPDGHSLASGGTDHVAKVWDVGSGRLEREFRGHDDRINPIFFSPDGRTLVTGSFDNTVRSWDVATGEPSSRLGSRGVPAGLSPDGSTLAVVGHVIPALREWDPSIQLFDIRTGRTVGRYRQGRDFPLSLPSCAADGVAWAEGGQGTISNIWREGPASPQLMVDLSSIPAPPGVRMSASAAAFSRDGKSLAYSIGRVIILMDRPNFRVVRCWEGHRDGVSSLAFSPKSDRLASGSLDTTVAIWDLGLLRGDQRQGDPKGHSDFP